jgi:hypothetical protein
MRGTDGLAEKFKQRGEGPCKPLALLGGRDALSAWSNCGEANGSDGNGGDGEGDINGDLV